MYGSVHVDLPHSFFILLTECYSMEEMEHASLSQFPTDGSENASSFSLFLLFKDFFIQYSFVYYILVQGFPLFVTCEER